MGSAFYYTRTHLHTLDHIACERRELCYMVLTMVTTYGAPIFVVASTQASKFSAKISQPGLLAFGPPLRGSKSSHMF